jgi:hypothetical protein
MVLLMIQVKAKTTQNLMMFAKEKEKAIQMMACDWGRYCIDTASRHCKAANHLPAAHVRVTPKARPARKASARSGALAERTAPSNAVRPYDALRHSARCLSSEMKKMTIKRKLNKKQTFLNEFTFSTSSHSHQIEQRVKTLREKK